MTTTLQRAERILVDAHGRLLDFADEVGKGKWAGKNSEAVMHMVGISNELSKATALLFASDGTEQNTPSSLDIH